MKKLCLPFSFQFNFPLNFPFLLLYFCFPFHLFLSFYFPFRTIFFCSIISSSLPLPSSLFKVAGDVKKFLVSLNTNIHNGTLEMLIRSMIWKVSIIILSLNWQFPNFSYRIKVCHVLVIPQLWLINSLNIHKDNNFKDTVVIQSPSLHSRFKFFLMFNLQSFKQCLGSGSGSVGSAKVWLPGSRSRFGKICSTDPTKNFKKIKF